MKPKKSAPPTVSKKPGKGGKNSSKASVTKKSASRPKAVKAVKSKARTVKANSTNFKTPAGQERWNLRLYVAGQTPRSITAFSNLKRLCEERLAGRYKIEVIDLVKQPQLAQGDQIVAIPTLVRKLPEPIKRVVGDLSNIERVLVGMDLQATSI